MNTYFEEIKRSMEWLSNKDDVLFCGQTTVYPGTACHKSFVDVDKSKLIEFPVYEASQFGNAVGLSLGGYTVLNLFPRINFLLSAIDPLVNFLDKLNEVSKNEWKCRVITRTVIGSEKPLWPGAQHTGDYTEALKKMCSHIHVERLDTIEQIFPAYQNAYERDGNSLLIEWADKYE
jgi:pyruvate/2-oxoglutarate/acetoin dehydrogenase E1 component